MNLNVFCIILVGRESETDFLVATACVDQDASVLLPLRIYFSYGTMSRGRRHEGCASSELARDSRAPLFQIDITYIITVCSVSLENL